MRFGAQETEVARLSQDMAVIDAPDSDVTPEVPRATSGNRRKCLTRDPPGSATFKRTIPVWATCTAFEKIVCNYILKLAK